MLAGNVVHLEPESAAFQAMLEGWRRQQAPRYLGVESSCAQSVGVALHRLKVRRVEFGLPGLAPGSGRAPLGNHVAPRIRPLVASAFVAYEDPLAYLVGMEGLALLRAFGEGRDQTFVDARLAEVRRLLDAREAVGLPVEVEHPDLLAGYRAWAPAYDSPDNAAFAVEEPHVWAILDGLPAGQVLDAACGTGRHCARLAARGHSVIGVDASADMLSRARINVSGVDFREGDLEALPVDDGAVDVVVCALALAHLTDLAPVYAEFARVLRAGGHLVVSDVHPEAVLRGSQPAVRIDGRPARIRNYRHHAADHLGPALQAGLQVAGCVEPRLSAGSIGTPPAEEPGPWETWPWSLAAMVPEAAAAASDGEPAMVIWHYRAPTP